MTTTRTITLVDYQRIVDLGAIAHFQPERFAKVSTERLQKALELVETADKQPEEALVFEVSATDPLDQKLMGYRYFTAINRVKATVQPLLGERQMDRLLGFTITLP